MNRHHQEDEEDQQHEQEGCKKDRKESGDDAAAVDEKEEEDGEEGEEDDEGDGGREATSDEERESEDGDGDGDVDAAGISSGKRAHAKRQQSAKVLAGAMSPIPRPTRPSDLDGRTVTQQKRMGRAWTSGPTIDLLYFKYVQEDYTRRQAAVDQLRERLNKKSRPGYELRVSRQWTCRTVMALLIRRHLSWMPCVVTTMADAAWDGDILLIHSLLLLRGNVNDRDANGQLLLNIAIQQQHEPIVRLLLDRGADFDLQDEHTLTTPLISSIIMGNKALTRRLLKRGADVNLADGEGITPLLWAAIRGYLEVVAQLIKVGADPNHQDVFGWTALHIVCFKGYVDLVEYLLVNAKVQWNLEDVNGFTPFMYARIAENSDIVAKLDNFAANASKKKAGQWGSKRGKTHKQKKKKNNTPVIAITSPKLLLASSAK